MFAMNPWIRSHRDEYKEARKWVPLIFSDKTGKTNDQRWAAFVNLRRSFLFKKIGMGLMNRIIHRADQKLGKTDFIHGVSFSVGLTFRRKSSTEPNSIEVQFGAAPSIESLEKIKDLKTRILNREYKP